MQSDRQTCQHFTTSGWHCATQRGTTTPQAMAPTSSGGIAKYSRQAISLVKSRVLAGAHCTLWLIVLAVCIRSNGHGTPAGWRRVAVYIHPLGALLHAGLTMWHMPAWNRAQRLDRMAFLMYAPPVHYIIGSVLLPSFDPTVVQWHLVSMANVLIGVVVVEMPPAHSLLHTVVISIGFG